MTDKQPEALQIADRLERILSDWTTAHEAAAELRRLHAVNQGLVDALTLARNRMLDMMQQDDGQANKDARKAWRRLRTHSPQQG